MKRIYSLLFFLPILLFSAEHSVQIGSSGNALRFKVSNTKRRWLRDIKVEVVKKPDWITFQNCQTRIKKLKPGSSQDIEFEFDVSSNAPSNSSGDIFFIVLDKATFPIYEKTISLRTESAVTKTELSAIFPNPSNNSTSIFFSLDQPSHVKIHVYNIIGQRIHTLIDDIKAVGNWEIQWDGCNGDGINVSSGVYLILLEVHRKDKTQKFIKKITIQK